MKKRVISWLLCLALCLSMLSVAALAEDVQAPEGPASSMNEPQPEPRAKENETPAPEPEKKVQSELMTAEKLLMPLSLGDENSPFSSISIVVSQDGTEIGDNNQGILNKSVTLYGDLICKDAAQRDTIMLNSTISLKVDGVESKSGLGKTTNSSEILVQASDFTPEKENYTITLSIAYREYSKIITRDLAFKKCTHPSLNDSTGKCSQCGAALVAELTAGASSSATYYETLTKALDAAQEAAAGSTVTLLDNCSLGSYELQKGIFTLDLDGHALTQTGNPLWVSGTANLTVKNNSSNAKNTGEFSLQSETATLSVTKSSKYALLMNSVSGMNVACFLGPDMGYKKADRAWASFSELRGTAIYNVTVEEAPFTTSDITVSPEDAYVNRKVALSVTLSNLKTGTTPTCSYFVSDSSNNQTSYEGITLDANQAFTAEFTPRVDQYYIQAWITADEFTVVKTIKKTFKTCAHSYGDVDQKTGFCSGCNSQMAASVSPSSFVDQRTYYETFDLAMKAAWEMLKSKDCWFTMFQDAQVGTIEYQYLNVLGGKTLYMDLNEKTLTSRGVAFRVPAKEWKLNLSNGTVIGDTTNHKPVQGVIEVEAGGSLNVHGGTIQNKGAADKGVNAPSIMVHGYSSNSGPVRGYAYIAGDADSNFGSLFISGGNVTANGGTYDHAKVTYGGSLEVINGRFQGDVTVDDHTSLVVNSNLAYFDGTLTFEPYGMGRLTNGNYKHIITKEATLGKLSNNTLDVFYIGEVYQPDAKNQPIMEKTFETTGTITQNTQSNLISKDENIYNSAANTYEFDLDSYLTAIKDDLGTMSYGTPQPQSLQSGIGTPVLEGHTLKLPVSAMLWTSPIELGKITIPVNSQNYANVSIEICLKLVERTAVTATATPSKTELTYGERLDTITLSGKTTPELQGTFVWQKPDAILDVGTYTELGWKFTPVDYTYAEASGTAKITVKQAKLQDPAPMTLMIYNGWAATYEAALPELPTLKEGLHFGNDAAYGTPDVSADGYYSSGAELKTVNGKQDVSIPILKNETTKEGQAGTITVQYTSQNYEPVTLAINLVAKNRTAPTFILTADHDTLSGGGKVTLTLERGNLPDGAVVMVSGTDEAGNAVTLTDNGDGTYSATLPNKTQTYTFIAVYDGSQTIAPKTDVATVKVQQRSSGGGEPAKPSFPVKISNSGDKKTAEIDLSGTKSGITDVTLPTDAVKKIVDSDVVSLTVKLPDVTVSFDDKALAAVAEQSSGADLSLSVNVGTANNSNLTDAQKNAITGARELSVIEVSLSSNGEKISNFNGGSVTIDVPFQWSMKGLLRAYYIDENGNKSAIDVTYKNGVATLVLNHFSTYVVEAVDALSFTDVSAKAYHFDAVAWAVKNKITSGQSDTLFAPDASCTRAQMVTFLWRANGSPEPTVTELPFTDVAADAYYAKAVLWAVENGITTGTSDTTFDPDGVVTRAEAVTFLWRSAGNPAAEGKLFADVESTKYYAEAVRWAVANGVTKGVSDTSFAPGSACTRAQIVTFLYRNCTNK